MGRFGVLAGRSSRCRLLVVLAAVLTLIAPVASVSFAQAAVASRVSWSVSPTVAAPAESVVMSGVVFPAAAGRTVWLQRHGSSWSTVVSAVTNSTGRFTTTVRAGVAGSKTSWRAVARPTTAAAAQGISVTRTLSVVKQALSLSAPASVETGLAFTLSGYGYPVRAGRPVVLQRRSGTSWTKVGQGIQSSTGRYAVSTTVSSAYRFSYRAVALSWRGAAGVTSPSRLVAAHPPYVLLTPAAAIKAETVKVSGKLPGVASRPVAVQRKSGTSWVTVAKATTTSAGWYVTTFRAPALGSYSVRTLAPRVTIAGRVRAQYVTAAKTLKVVVQTAALSMPATMVQGKTGTAKLNFRPVRAGRAVALHVVKSGVWTAVATGKQSSTGTASFTLTAGTPGSYSYRAWTAAADGAPWFASPTRTLVITPPVAAEPITSVTTLASSSTETSYDTPLTLTASVAGASGTPTGEVKFTDASNGSVLVVEALSGGVARLTTAALAPGTRKMVVTYSGDNVFLPSVSRPLVITVAPPQKTLATAFQNNSRHDGMATGDTFNPATLHQAWSINLTDPSATQTAFVSYPLIAGGRVFVTAANVNTNVRGWTELYALDATTGSVDWHTQVSNTSDPLGLTYDGGQVFVQTGDANRTNGHVTAYDASNGHINWTTTPGQREINSPPTAYDGVLYVVGTGSGGTLYALSEANGQVLWSAGVWNGDTSSPTVDDSGVYVTYACDLTHSFDLDGTERWRDVFGCSGGGGATSVLNGGHLYLRGGNFPPGALILSAATGAITGTFGGTGLPAFDEANMYVVGGGVLNAVDKAGSPGRWSFTGDGTIGATPVTTNGIVFTGSSNGNLYGIDSSTGTQVWTATATGAVTTLDGMYPYAGRHTGLAAADGLLAVPAGGYLTVYTN